MALARSFDGVDDIIVAAISTIATTEDWTIAAWVNPSSAGEGDAGCIVRVETSGGTARQWVRINASTRVVRALSHHGTTLATTVTNETLDTSSWTLVIATFRHSDSKCRVYFGDENTAMAEATYSSQVAGVGARGGSGTVVNLGNLTDGSATWDGAIGPVMIGASEWTNDEMESCRLGLGGGLTGLRGVWWMDSRDAATVTNQILGAAATVTGCTLAAGPAVGGVQGDNVIRIGGSPQRLGV